MSHEISSSIAKIHQTAEGKEGPHPFRPAKKSAPVFDAWGKGGRDQPLTRQYLPGIPSGISSDYVYMISCI